VVVIIQLVGWGFYERNLDFKRPIPMPTTSSISVSVTTPSPMSAFSDFSILKKFAFVDSTGKNKALIVVKIGDGDASIPVVDTYITAENISPTSAVKIAILSGKDSLLNYPITDPQSVLTSISPGPGKKFIVISSSEEEIGSFMTLIDENGQVISNEVADTVFPLVKDKCQCGFEFGTWKDQDKFYVVIPSAKGTYRVLIDAKTGKSIGTAEGIE
jgi:hypothetical protein